MVLHILIGLFILKGDIKLTDVNNLGVLYRYNYITSNINLELHTVDMYLHAYNVIKLTPKGKWIEYSNKKGRKFVLNNTRKGFARETKEGALNSFIARKEKQIMIMTMQLTDIKNALNKAMKMVPNEEVHAVVRTVSDNIIEIDGKDVKAGRIMNNYHGDGEIIATVFGSKNEVKKDLKKYEGKGYKFIYFINSEIHTVRIIKTAFSGL